jgi:hypothetical protein
MTAAWLEETAEAFWTLVGEPQPFPRDLADVVSLALPAFAVPLPALTFDRAHRWLDQRGSVAHLPCDGRRVRGCLVAYGGCGFIFLDGGDPPDERRFTLAHETAHFLIDYLRPRQRAIAHLGDAIVDVLDGRRRATRDERIDAVLAECPIGVHVHLLNRNVTVEDRADLLACELLAPAALVMARRPPSVGADQIARVLREEFGLAASQAGRYAARLARARDPVPSFVDWLRR